MGNFKKIIRHIKTPIILFRKMIHRLPGGFLKKKLLQFPSYKETSLMLAKILSENKGKTIYVFPSPNCPWGYMFQRPQQLARALAAEGNLVFYMTDTSYPYAPDWYVRGILEVEPGVFLFNDGECKIHEEFADMEVVIWQYWPHQYEYVNRFKEVNEKSLHLYDCIDDISTFETYEGILNDFNQSLNNSSIVLATSRGIYNDIISIRKDVIYIPNGVEIDDFSKPFIEIPSVILIKESFEYLVGYYGAIAEWFDFELLDKLSIDNPKLAFIIVGEVYKEVQDKVNELKNNNNIFFLNRMSYEMIPSLLSYFDVAIIPFVLNNITLSTSPVKVFEYLAGGKEVVSTALPEVQSIDDDFVAEDYYEFNMKLQSALLRGENQERELFLKLMAEQNTWKSRLNQVTERIIQLKDD